VTLQQVAAATSSKHGSNGVVHGIPAGYGRVGQNVQQDEHSPKRLDALSQRVKAAADPKVLKFSSNQSKLAADGQHAASRSCPTACATCCVALHGTASYVL
jgi:hypothetical protein